MISIDEKKQIVDALTDKVKIASGFYLADFFKINVEKITALRADLKEKGATMVVTKNTFLKRVFKNCEIEGMDEYLVNATSIIIASPDDPITPAKVIADFHKENTDLLKVKVVKVENDIMQGDKIKELAKMPGKIELQGQIVSIMMGPGANLIGLIKGPGGIVAGQVKSLIEKLEEN
jgi:large subunit ribosomal protein L10